MKDLEAIISRVEGELDSYTAQGRAVRAGDARRQLKNLRAMRPAPKVKARKKAATKEVD